MITIGENEVTKRLAAYAALVAVPTMVAGVYGMNFEHMPELELGTAAIPSPSGPDGRSSTRWLFLPLPQGRLAMNPSSARSSSQAHGDAAVALPLDSASSHELRDVGVHVLVVALQALRQLVDRERPLLAAGALAAPSAPGVSVFSEQRQILEASAPRSGADACRPRRLPVPRRLEAVERVARRADAQLESLHFRLERPPAAHIALEVVAQLLDRAELRTR